jgi:hypothetical protein
VVAWGRCEIWACPLTPPCPGPTHVTGVWAAAPRPVASGRPLHSSEGFSGLGKGEALGARPSLLARDRGVPSVEERTNASILQMGQGHSLRSKIRVQMEGGRGGGDQGRGLGEEEEQILGPSVVNHVFAPTGDILVKIPVFLFFPSGESWTQEAPRVPDLKG